MGCTANDNSQTFLKSVKSSSEGNFEETKPGKEKKAVLTQKNRKWRFLDIEIEIDVVQKKLYTREANENFKKKWKIEHLCYTWIIADFL